MKKVSIIIAALLCVAAPQAQQGAGSAGQAGGTAASQQGQSQPGTGLGQGQSGQRGSADSRPGGIGQSQPGQSSQTGIGQTPGQGRPGSPRQGASAANQQQITQLQTAFSQLGQGAQAGQAGQQSNEQLTRTLTLMAPRADTRHIRQFVTDSSRILARPNVPQDVHQQLASTVAAVLSPQTQQADSQALLTRLQQSLTTAGISSSDAQTLIRDVRMLASQNQQGVGARGSAPGSERSTIETTRPGQPTPAPGTPGQRPRQPGTETAPDETQPGINP